MKTTMLRTLILCTLLTGLIPSVIAQRIKFNDLVPKLEGMSRDEQKNSLKEYIALDPDHPNSNFRLALIYESNYKNADPLTEYEFSLANAEQAKIRFLKSKIVVDEREVNRNNEYYFPIFKTLDAKGKPKVEFSKVSAKIAGGYDSAIQFLSKIPPIYFSFTRSVNHYDRAVKLFAAINQEFMNLDDLYLYFNGDLDKRLGELKSNYDSARYFFDRYRDLTRAFPIPFHQQQYHVKPIVTYRLDGLITRMSFLTNEVELWDYGTWVDAIRKDINTEILSLRQKIILNEAKVDESLTRIAASNGEGMVPFKLDRQLVFNLNNFDKQSLVLAILEYKTYKQDWLIKSKTLQVDTASADRTADNFSVLIHENKNADTLLGEVKARLQPDKIRKHEAFINQYYGGTEGLLRFYEGEKKFMDSELIRYTAELRTALVDISAKDTVQEKEKTIRFMNKWNVSLHTRIATPEAIEKGELITRKNVRNRDGSTYLVGVYKPDKKANNLVTFLARVNPDGKPGWFQNFNIKIDSASATPDADNVPGPMELTQEGCAVIIRSTHLTRHDVINTLVYLNEKGEDKFRIKLKESGFPRTIQFQEHSNSFVLVLKGQVEEENTSMSENIRLLSVNAIGDLLWQRELPVTGSYVNLINLMDGYLVVGNYAAIRDQGGKEFRTKTGESGPVMIRLNARGEITLIRPVVLPQSLFVVKAVKVSDNAINLLGFEDTFNGAKSKTVLSPGRLMHIMTNQFCQIICSNL